MTIESQSLTSDSEADEDVSYLKRAMPEKKAIVNLRKAVAVQDLQSGVDFEIEDIRSELLDAPPLEDTDNQDYISEICSQFSSLNCSGDFGEGSDALADFEALKQTMEDITGRFSSSHSKMIFKKVLEHSSDPDSPLATSGLVTIDYSAYLEGQDEPFDSTKRRKLPFIFRIGDLTVIEGLELAVKTMRVNERSRFLVAPELTFGKLGLLNVIPKNSDILFDVTLIDCIAGDAIDQLENNSQHSHDSSEINDPKRDLQLRLSASMQWYKMGNSRYKLKNYAEALKNYVKASVLVSMANMRTDEEDETRMVLWARTIRGIARCLFNLAKYRECKARCQELLQYYPEDPVANLLKGECLMLMPDQKNVQAAIKAFQMGLKGNPNSSALADLLNKAILERNAELQTPRNDGQLTQGLGAFCGTSSAQPPKAPALKSESALFANVKERFKERIKAKVKEVVDGSKHSYSVPTMNLTSDEFEYLKCVAEDNNLAWEQKGAGLDAVLVICMK